MKQMKRHSRFLALLLALQLILSMGAAGLEGTFGGTEVWEDAQTQTADEQPGEPAEEPETTKEETEEDLGGEASPEDTEENAENAEPDAQENISEADNALEENASEEAGEEINLAEIMLDAAVRTDILDTLDMAEVMLYLTADAITPAEYNAIITLNGDSPPRYTSLSGEWDDEAQLGLSISSNTLYFNTYASGKTYFINGTATDYAIQLTNVEDITFILYAVDMKHSSVSPLSLNGSSLTLKLFEDTQSNFASASSGAGINVPVGARLTIEGTGEITVSGSANSAGIGGINSEDAGEIIINSGTVSASGGSNAAGIGGGNQGNGGEITINGGTVTVIGDTYGTGIGGGFNGWWRNYYQWRNCYCHRWRREY